MFVALFAVAWWAEAAGIPVIDEMAVAGGGNMEGKEPRFGVVNSALWAGATTAASNGSVNAMHDSFTPLGGTIPLFGMMTGEVIFGGVGAGFYGMLLYVVLTVFVAGLMVGRTPEYLGKKIEAREVKLAMLAFFSMPTGILIGDGLAAVVPAALAAVQDPGLHGLSEILYAYSSATGNNGSAFAGYGWARPGTRRRRASPCCSVAQPSSSRCSPWRGRWRASARSRRRSAPSRRTRRSSSDCGSRSS